MPTGTKVDRCFQKLKGKKGESSAAAICQTSTSQSLATGKTHRKSDGKKIGSKHESFERKLTHALSATFNEQITPITTATGFSAEQVQSLSQDRAGEDLRQLAIGVLNGLYESRRFMPSDVADVQVLQNPLQMRIVYRL